jgi:hypothetical protein
MTHTHTHIHTHTHTHTGPESQRPDLHGPAVQIQQVNTHTLTVLCYVHVCLHTYARHTFIIYTILHHTAQHFTTPTPRYTIHYTTPHCTALHYTRFHKHMKRVTKLAGADGGSRFTAVNAFKIMHYAGEVIYDAEGFLMKNNDSSHPDTKELLSTSSNALATLVLTDLADVKSSAGGDEKVNAGIKPSSELKKNKFAQFEHKKPARSSRGG